MLNAIVNLESFSHMNKDRNKKYINGMMKIEKLYLTRLMLTYSMMQDPSLFCLHKKKKGAKKGLQI